ncbi:MAG: AarF/ABC1/UbiB kinase family protein [Candidatus Baltobacteraceae bacterium]|jgi:ubiquinone biosynthesis protein
MLDEALQTTLRELLETLPLVPEIYASYRPLVTDGFVYFLSGLSDERVAGIVAEQMRLPENTSVDDRLVKLLHSCPTLHKLGQVVGHDKRLAPELRQRLQSLESLAPTSDLPEIEAVLERELGAIPPGIELASAALAEGSVAVVLPFEWTRPGATARQRGVFKILKPLAEEQLREELALWPKLGEYLEERCTHYDLPVLDYRNTLDSVRSLLLNEIRLDLEQKHLAKAARFYADSPAVVVPKLFPFCTPHVTAMERVDGRKVTDPSLAPSVRQRLAETIIESLLAKPFWSEDSTALFHADPHAGNLFATDDGRLAILDWALVVELSKEQRAAVVQTVLGALTLDEPQTTRAIASFGNVLDQRKLEEAVDAAFRLVRRGTFPGFDWLTTLLDGVMTTASMQFPEELTLFRKALLSMSGVVADVSGRPSLDQVLTKTAAVQFFRELGRRPRAQLDSRDFGSHLSNEDLICTWAALFFIPSRYWIGTLRDALGVWAKAGP